MRTLRAVVTLSTALQAWAVTISTRKSLRFAPPRPEHYFVTEPQSTPALAGSDPLEVAGAFLRSHVESDYFIRDDSYTDTNTGITHVYARQRIDGIEVADGDINLDIYDGRVLSYGDSFFSRFPTRRQLASPEFPRHLLFWHRSRRSRGLLSPTLRSTARRRAAGHCCGLANGTNDPRRAALYFMIYAHPDSSFSEDLARDFNATLARMTVTYERGDSHSSASLSGTISGLPGAVSSVKARVVYVQTLDEQGGVELHATWRLEVEMTDNWYEAYVSTKDPSILVSVIDWVTDSPEPVSEEHLNALEAKSRRVGQPEWGQRTVEPASYDAKASPLGIGTERDKGPYLNFTTTWGNNVFAQENLAGRSEWISNYRPDGGESLKFEFPYGVKEGLDKSPEDYLNLSVTQLFYTANMVHDLYYRYGFDEAAGNFQQDNFGRSGRDGDAVIISAQDGSGMNNANFVTPPDGQHGRCRMYIWRTATPYRDGALDAGIVIHELSHGLSNRLTGGPTNPSCLGWGEGAGMGEGWGDFLATTVRATGANRHDHFPMGSWASNMKDGIRHFIYSNDTSDNPSMYETLNGLDYWIPHSIGEVWAEILWVISQRMVEIHGYSPNLFPPQPLEDGTVPLGDFYRQSPVGERMVPKHGNTLMLQLVIEGMKIQPCRPTFFNARDAIIEADKRLTGGENYCLLWNGFSSRGLGKNATMKITDPWGGANHTNGFEIPEECMSQ
ncbi:extracellular metalloproteinase MEP [Ceratobasidium sp. AG-Ba]|nr:extracellular metalloproteinase MEP [Ceratobasidium sp. AG-Ba]